MVVVSVSVTSTSEDPLLGFSSTTSSSSIKTSTGVEGARRSIVQGIAYAANRVGIILTP